MGFYQINDLEQLSGVKAHTIRIWEKRYAIIVPYRTSTNIRYYDDAQLKKLLNVAGLVSAGYKISYIASLKPSELKEEIRRVQESDAAGRSVLFINELVATMLQYDEEQFASLYTEIITRFGVEEAMLGILYPFLQKTGLLWSLDETMPVQEHFASTLIRRKLYSLIDKLPLPGKKRKFLLFLPAGEWHELPLLFAEYLIRSHDCKTINLSQNVPLADMEAILRKVKPTYLLTILTSSEYTDEIGQVLSLLARDFPGVMCLLGGSEQKLKAHPPHKNLQKLNKPNDILKLLR